jgi:hypothetical protein
MTTKTQFPNTSIDKPFVVRTFYAKPVAETRNTYALATETYVEQDGWVLLADGARQQREVLPALWNHNIDKVVGKWTNFRTEGNEVRAEIEWVDTEIGKDVRKLHDAGIAATSIRFDITHWRHFDSKDRERYQVPEGSSWGGVAERWIAPEASFVSIPADPNSGPRALRTRAAEVIGEAGVNRLFGEDSEKSSTQPRQHDAGVVDFERRVFERLERLQSGLDELAEKLTVVAARVSNRDVQQNTNETGRFYNKQTLGMIADRLDKAASEMVLTNARTHEGSGAGPDRKG